MAKCTIRVKCCECGNVWSLDWQDAEKCGVTYCHECGATIPANLWDKEVVKAARAVFDCNLELDKNASRINGKQLSVDFIGTDEVNA